MWPALAESGFGVTAGGNEFVAPFALGLQQAFGIFDDADLIAVARVERHIANTIAAIAAVSVHSPIAPEMNAAASRIQTTTSANCPANRFHSGSPGEVANSFQPSLSRMALTRAAVSPLRPSTPNAVRQSAELCANAADE